jgi:predicted exporter
MTSRWIAIPWLLWLAVASWVLLYRTPITTDLTFFLPRNAGMLDSILVQQMREGPASRLLMVAIEGGDEAQRAEASRQLTERLRSRPEFESVTHGAEPRLLANLEQRLFPYRYSLSPVVQPGHFDPPALRSALMQRLDELASPAGAFQKDWLTRDPTGEWRYLLSQWMETAGPSVRNGVWVSQDEQRALVLAKTRASGFDLDAQATAQQQVRENFQAVADHTELRLILGGPGALSVEANTRITEDATRLSLINGVLIMALIFAVYRSLRVLGLGLIPLITGVMTGAAATSLIFGQVHGITLGFGATLVGVAADFPNHFFTHLNRHESPERAMNRIWPTLRLGLLTNIAGFSAMLFSGFAGLSQLAVFASAGLLAAGLATRWVLPPLSGTGVQLPAWVEHGSSIKMPAHWPSWGRGTPPVMTVMLIGIFLASGHPLWNDDVAALNPVPAARQKLDEALQRDFNAPDLGKLIVITSPDMESVLQVSESLTPTLEDLQQQKAFASFDLAARYLPSQSLQRLCLAALPDADTLESNLRQAQQGLLFKKDIFDPFVQELTKAHQRGPLQRSDLDGTPLADRVAGLLLPLQQGWAALIPLSGIANESAIHKRLESFREKGVHFVDLREESSRLMRDYRQEALRLLAISLAVIVGLLALGLRSGLEALRVFFPVLAATVCTAILMALLFDGLNLYHLVSLLLVTGLSLDQALFFNRDAAEPEERRRTLLSLLVCSTSAVLAFGTLAFSETNILRAIGTTVAVGAILAIGFAALLAQRSRSSR